MGGCMKITSSELRKLTSILLDYLENNGLNNIEIMDDFYWAIPVDDLYDPLKDPDISKLTLGKLTDEYEFLQRISKDKSLTTMQAFVWLAAILRNIGNRQTLGGL